MATRFTYLGFEYEILEGKQNEVALIDASNAHGRTIIPSKVKFEGDKYSVTMITGKEVMVGCRQYPDDRRRKPYIIYKPIYIGAFSCKKPRTDEGLGYDDNTNSMEIIIPDSITNIGDGAFRNCIGLTSVLIGNSVTNIGRNAFYNCEELKHVKLGENVKSIESDAFYHCTSLTNITIPSSVKTIHSGAFKSSSFFRMKLEHVKIENEEGMVHIDSSAFESTVKIEYVGIAQKKGMSIIGWFKKLKAKF